MSIEMQCAGCGQRIRVGDEHAGKKARCPACGTITLVPAGGEPAETVEDLRPEKPAENPFAKTGTPFGTGPAGHVGVPNPHTAPTAGSRLKPHRGGLILTLAILGLLCCMPLGIAAWIRGVIDLGEMRRGEMDPSGQSLTQVGMILGIVATALGVLGTLVSILASFA
jgi:ribosomal protein S27E